MIPILRRVTNGTALFLKEIPEPVKDAAGIFCIIVLFAASRFTKVLKCTYRTQLKSL